MKKRTSILLFWLVIAVFVVAMFIPMGCGGDSGGGGGGDTGSVYGTVTDQNGLPVQSATCSIDTAVNGKEIYSSTTGELGQFTIAGVPVGTWTLSISKSGYQTKNITVTVNSGSTTEVPSEDTVITPGTSPTPTPTPSPTGTVTPTPSPTGTVTPSPTPTSSPGPGPGPVPVPGISGWEWQNPKPQGDYRINGFHGTQNVRILVGEDGMVWRQSGNEWTKINSGLGTDLNGVWGSANGKNWFIVGRNSLGTGVILFSNDFGQTWTRQTTLGGGGDIPDVTMRSVSGATDGTHVFAVGDETGGDGVILYSALGDGSDWVLQNSGRNADIYDVWSSDDGSVVYACGTVTGGSGTLIRSDDHGANWNQCTLPLGVALPGQIFMSVYGDGAGNNRIFAVGTFGCVVFGPAGLQDDFIDQTGVFPVNTTLRGVFVFSGGNVVVCGNRSGAGNNGTVVYDDSGIGINWSNKTSADTGDQQLRAVFGDPAQNTYFCFGGESGGFNSPNGIFLASDNGIDWVQNIAQPNHVWTRINDMSAADANNVFAVGEAVGGRPLILSTANGGTLWTQYAAGVSPGDTALNSVWARTADDVYAVGDAVGGAGISRRYNGVAWADNDSVGIGNINWFGVHGYDANSIYAVGEAGCINRNNGGGWEGQVAVGGGANQLNGVYCAGAGNSVYAVGENADLWKYTGGAWVAGSWTDVSAGITATDDLKDVWAADENNVFVVGDDANNHGVLYVSDDGGANWQRKFQGLILTKYRSVWGSSANHVFIVGERGRILYYNGSTVQMICPAATIFQTITTKELYGVTGSSGTNVFIGGALDTIIHSTTD